VRYDREPWRKLYRSEPFEQRAWPMMTRGIRDYLVRFADDDGTLLQTPGDDPIGAMIRVLNSDVTESEHVRNSLEQLFADGYLVHDARGVWIRNFAEAQEARSPDAKRMAAKRAREKAAQTSKKAANSPGGARPNTKRTTVRTPSVTSSEHVTVEEKRREEKRSTTTPTPSEPAEPAAPGGSGGATRERLDQLPIRDRALRWIRDPGARPDIGEPSQWPEVQALAARHGKAFPGQVTRFRTWRVDARRLEPIVSMLAEYPVRELEMAIVSAGLAAKASKLEPKHQALPAVLGSCRQVDRWVQALPPHLRDSVLESGQGSNSGQKRQQGAAGAQQSGPSGQRVE